MSTLAFTRQQVREFVRQNAPAATEVESYRRKALSAEYWESLCPVVTVGRPTGRPAAPLKALIEESRFADAAKDFNSHGYLSLTDIFEPSEIATLREAVFAVHEAGWPMIFALVYDQFWSLLRTEKFAALINRIVGPRHQLTVLFWMHYVPVIPGAAGFPPHKDGGCGYPTMSCWIPLSPATLDNGCMYVVERNPVIDEIAASFGKFDSFTKKQMHSLLNSTRALPIGPGGVLAWQHTTLHWGSTYRRGGVPRLAVSWEVTTAEYDSGDPALRAALYTEEPLPNLENRLRWIAQSIMSFRGRDVLMERFVPVLHGLLNKTGEAHSVDVQAFLQE